MLQQEQQQQQRTLQSLNFKLCALAQQQQQQLEIAASLRHWVKQKPKDRFVCFASIGFSFFFKCGAFSIHKEL